MTVRSRPPRIWPCRGRANLNSQFLARPVLSQWAGGAFFSCPKQCIHRQAITVPTAEQQRVGFATTPSRVHNRTRCTFLTLRSRNVWSEPKGTRVFSTRKHGVVCSLTAVPNGLNALAHTQSSMASSLPSLRLLDLLYSRN